MNPLFWQIINNAIILFIAIAIISFSQRGFFWKFIRVKLSFGKFILCKVRAINRDYYKIGRIVEGFLIYKVDRNNHKRIAINDSSVFYRSLGTTWVDIDDSKNAMVKPDYSTVDGFDAVKYNDLYIRALYKPQINEVERYFKIIIFVLIIAIIVSAVNTFFSYNTFNQIGVLQQMVSGFQGLLQKGTVVATSTP